MSTREHKLEIANTIMDQLGGFARLRAMTGAKDAAALDSGVQFSIGRNHRQINKVQITLNSMDTYDMKFLSIRKKRNSWDYQITTKAEYSGVYADQLPELFEDATGMYLSIPQVVGINA